MGWKTLLTFIFICTFFVLIINLGCKQEKKTETPFYEKAIDNEKIEVIDSKVKLLSKIGAPDTLSDKFYSRLTDLAYVPENKLFVLDNIAGCVRVFSTITGEEIFKFGNKGRGPGEFMSGNRIRYCKDEGIIVVDNDLLRTSFFNENGKFNGSFRLPYKIDDVIFMDDSTAIMSCFLLEEEFKPIKLYSIKSMKILNEFGSIKEPQEGFLKKIRGSPFYGSDIELFSYGFMTRILYDENSKRVIFSQRHPYILHLISISQNSIIPFNVSVPFSTYNNLEYVLSGSSRTTKIVPSGRALGPALIDQYIVIPIFRSDGQENYLDCYDREGNFRKRLRMPNLSKETNVSAWTIGPDAEIYLLIINSDGINWIEKMKLELF